MEANTFITEDRKNIQDEIVEYFVGKYPEVEAVYIYGSWGTEYQAMDSDIDIGILFQPTYNKMGIYEWFDTQDDIAGIANVRSADVADLRSSKDVFQGMVVDAGRRIYVKKGKEGSVEQFERTARVKLDMYMLINNMGLDPVIESIKRGELYYG